ncbi:hypothetical protein [Ornithinimicrobium cerasi]|uniref:Uncharacterized protein n=1 Tax=Ornithinimicrobium cerasi TaxID=2248773 RepID=A0A285VF13_9MICO|nr:hypothetical protein [Ornithinimicrobium cerasi]SOC51111.1 hypothetical protein SAMN05421879_10130 [Ornithinimicrobium cerasi]
MSGHGSREWDEARWVLVHVSEVIPGVRWELSRMRLDVLDAHLRLAGLASPRGAAGPAAADLGQGVLLRGVVRSCEQGTAAGAAVHRRLQEAIACYKAAAVLVGGVRPVRTHQGLAGVRLRRDFDELRTRLEAARPLLSAAGTSLREVADCCRAVLPALSGTGAGIADVAMAERLYGMVLSAADQTRRIDLQLDRAQASTGQLITRVGPVARDAGLRQGALRHEVGPPAATDGIPR